LDSVLAQTYHSNLYEVIVVDDGSTDGTEEALGPLLLSRIKYFRQENKGPASARNEGIAYARGEIIAFTDDDCIVPPNWIKVLMDGFLRYSDVVGVGGYMEADEETIATSVYARLESYITHQVYKLGDKEIYGEHVPIATNNAAYKKQTLKELGGFDESFRYPAGEDADLNLRIASHGYKTLFVPVKVTHFQEYSFKRLQRQCVLRGRAGAQIALKHGCRIRGIMSALFKAATAPLLLVRDAAITSQKIEASLHRLVEFYIAIVMVWTLLMHHSEVSPRGS